jgi:murein DD-endopeptidase MepM/ murein hydrolase activator NlpD
MTVTIGGEAAGEPLHFEAIPGEGRFWALVAVPLEATDSLLVRLTIERPGTATDTLAIQLPVSTLTVSTDQLRASPEFSRAPDSALAARAAREAELMGAARRHSHETPRLWSEQFVQPVPGRVTSRFGARREWNGALRGRHDGVDLAGAAGTPVRAANRGVVALVADQYYGGLTVFIDHGAGLVTSYQHLSGATVTVGDTVARGAVVGRVGATGNTTGPHLHWGTSYGAIPVDPLVLLTVQPPP